MIFRRILCAEVQERRIPCGFPAFGADGHCTIFGQCIVDAVHSSENIELTKAEL